MKVKLYHPIDQQNLPVNSFYAISQKPHEILMSDMTNGINLSPKFFFCLSPINQFKSIMKTMLYNGIKIITCSLAKISLQIIKNFLDCYLCAINQSAPVNNSISTLPKHILCSKPTSCSLKIPKSKPVAPPKMRNFRQTN